MSQEAIEQLLKQTMGLNSASIGSSSIARAVQQRMRVLGINSMDLYQKRLSSGAELQELIEEIIVPETWFFRDRNPFIALARHATERWPTRGRYGPLRILSVPCSTGEEPYTIAMTLLEAGLTAYEFTIDAVDISTSNLRRAQTGLYRENSFRGDDISFRARHFQQSDENYLLKPQIRALVNFHHANLLAPGFFNDVEPYDVVFCRNLLIYFDRDTQAQALKVLERLLQPDGLLFLGHAEAGVLAGRQFFPLDHARSFAFVHGANQRATQAEIETPFQLPKKQRTASVKRQPVTPAPARSFSEKVYSDAIPDPVPTQRPDLESATQLANEGHLVEAANFCEQYLREQGPDAQAFYLLALVREAVGEGVEAEALLRKALYLDPNHYESLTHLALILERRGDHANAALTQQRAKRSFERQRNEAAQRAEGK